MSWGILIFYQIFLSPQVKRSVIITNKDGMYESPHNFSNDGNYEIPQKFWNFVELDPSVQYSY